jgi:septum site-determining protein MinD
MTADHETPIMEPIAPASERHGPQVDTPVAPPEPPRPAAPVAAAAIATPEAASAPVATPPVTQPIAAKTERKNLAEVIVVTSGKGGVGKTTTSASLACGLARAGKKVAVIDFDVGLRNLDLIMGCERRVVYDFVNVIQGECTLRQALIKDKRFDNLFVLAASQTRDKEALTKEGVEKVLKDLGDDGFQYIVCDSPAGIEKGAFLAMYYADHAVVVVNPEVSSVRDSDRILGLLSSKTHRAEKGLRVKEHLLLTRYSPKRVESGDMLSIKDVQEILGLEVIGVIPESPEVLQSSNSGEPVILDANSQAGQAYDDAVARLLGDKQRPLRFTTVEKKGFFSKLFGG